MLIRKCMVYALSWTIICLAATFWDYQQIQNDNIEPVQNAIKTLLEKNQVKDCNGTNIDKAECQASIASLLSPYQELKNRSLRTLYVTHLFFWGTGLLIISLSFHRSKKRLLQRLAAEQVLREQNEKIQLFAYSVAHDLKNPIIAIYGLAKIINKRHLENMDQKSRQYCAQIEQSAGQVSSLIDQINAFISSKEQPLNIEPINLLETSHTVRAENEQRLKTRGVQWTEPTEIVTIEADKLVILRILRNLVDNALKYGGQGLGNIILSHEESADFHTIAVANDGNPLAAEDCSNIFQVYKRNCLDSKVEGTGLGLAIVKELVTLHGGRVWVESDGKKGVTFSFTIAKNLSDAKSTSPPC